MHFSHSTRPRVDTRLSYIQANRRSRLEETHYQFSTLSYTSNTSNASLPRKIFQELQASNAVNSLTHNAVTPVSDTLSRSFHPKVFLRVQRCNSCVGYSLQKLPLLGFPKSRVLELLCRTIVPEASTPWNHCCWKLCSSVRLTAYAPLQTRTILALKCLC